MLRWLRMGVSPANVDEQRPSEQNPLLRPNSPKETFQNAVKKQINLDRVAHATEELRADVRFKQIMSRPLKRVVFNSQDHISVLFQMHGSVWPRVLPFCVASVLVTYGIYYVSTHHYDVTLSSTGHQFMGILVSFLVVTRVQITYQRFMEARGYLSTCYRCCRELMQHAIMFTMTNTSQPAIAWRRDLAFDTILLLRVTMAAIEFKSNPTGAWDTPQPIESDRLFDINEMKEEDQGNQHPDLRSSFKKQQSRFPRNASSFGWRAYSDGAADENRPISSFRQMNGPRVMKWAHGKRTMTDENFRAPIQLAYRLRAHIVKQRVILSIPHNNTSKSTKDLTPPPPTKRILHCNEELRLLNFVSDFITAFHGLKSLITTPFPFPLVQMARTFLFVYVFTLPLCLVENLQVGIGQVCVIMFFIAYGFIGLEYVSMEMDDPFGDDPNDFDDMGLALMVFEDIYISIYNVDGVKSAKELQSQVEQRIYRADPLTDTKIQMAEETKQALY